MKTVIMAGGRGTRIAAISDAVPKPMIKIADKPVLEHQIECLREQGFIDIILTVSYLGDAVIDYFGDGSKISKATGKPFGVHIEYFIEESPLGNAGALFKLREQLTDDFLMLNADLIFDVDLKRFVAYHKEKKGWVTLFTHPNSHPYDSGLIMVDENYAVTRWLTKEEKRPEYYQNRVNAGLHVISPRLLDKEITVFKVDLDRQLLKPLAGSGTMFAYDSPEYVKDMGIPERYEQVCQDFARGKIHAKNMKNKQKAIFLDRDGTVNKQVGFLKDIDTFELMEGAAEAIREINQSEYLAIIVTNQPVVARGDVSFEELREIHNKMEFLLGLKGAYVDGIYYCPHHPDKGFEGENRELKIKCGCRKPNPGMLLQAAGDFNINLKESWMVGDEERDIKAGIAAGCRTAMLFEKKGKIWTEADIYADSLHMAVEKIMMEDAAD